MALHPNGINYTHNEYGQVADPLWDFVKTHHTFTTSQAVWYCINHGAKNPPSVRSSLASLCRKGYLKRIVPGTYQSKVAP